MNVVIGDEIVEHVIRFDAYNHAVDCLVTARSKARHGSATIVMGLNKAIEAVNALQIQEAIAVVKLCQEAIDR